ncbi:MAG: hypothetical protein CO013_09200 [Syntrophobacterales bacterium CG_4_8_14_3_um_filter_58_8]|nr:MAG: hypothetical protein AUK26_05425 [Syntrophaceae bacterium CG2_30_58_14]PIV07365.1 MAG: hypothetical protein COS57_00180 [Syntrophobacterales bacterium CG03_land_8_20_14_0_80_58_14]PJC72467.1 MAG: hypothetical protein CO013_09200 [Syntrophobacterales bacterium CG_4_8_14_3_um_filter_58_8]
MTFLSNGIIFLLMGFTDSLPILLVLRLIQGSLGATSTVGLFMFSQLSSKDRLAGSNLLTLYLIIAALTVGVVLAFWVTTSKTPQGQY